MEDKEIVDLYWERNETAIKETEIKYGHYLTKVAYGILADIEDTKECVNDTYLKAWNSMPDSRPNKLTAFLAKITRDGAIDIYRKKVSKKRNGSQYNESLDEIAEMISGGSTPEQELETQELSEAINKFIRELPEKKRDLFVWRYFFMYSIKDISQNTRMSESKIKTTLFRIRNDLKEYLTKEGYAV